MIIRKLLRSINGNQGFTLIEVITVMAITGIIGLGAAMATNQIVSQGGRNSEYTTASRNTMNAIYWISRDAQMSQTLTPGGAEGFPLTLSWTEWDNSEHQVIYSITDGQIRRSYSIDGGSPQENLVAAYIDSATENATTCDFSDRTLTMKITAVVGEGSRAVSVTKIREVTPRPGL